MSADSTLSSEDSEPSDDLLTDWESRKRLAHLLYDKGAYQEAADLIWEVPEIPSIDIELAFAARILAKGSPRKAIRLLTALLEHNRGKGVQNLALANALLNHGMVLQAARFYGAALEADPTLANPDLEHFILWVDDEEKLWGNFRRARPQLGELPWMRDPKVAMKLTNRIVFHSTPINMPGLPSVPGEALKNELYLQEPRKGMLPTPPPAVTIPLGKVDSKHLRYDAIMGAPSEPGSLPSTVALEAAGPEQPIRPQVPERPFVAAPAALAPPTSVIPSFSIVPPPAPVVAPPTATMAPPATSRLAPPSTSRLAPPTSRLPPPPTSRLVSPSTSQVVPGKPTRNVKPPRVGP